MNAPVALMSHTRLTSLEHRILAIRDKAATLIQESDNEHLLRRWESWSWRFDELVQRCREDVRVEISVVGATGAGKSTLLNALIGVRLLPVSNMRACTAAITQVAFHPGDYHAHVEFISLDAWRREVACLRGDFEDLQYTDEKHDGGESRREITKAVRDKLRAVYGISDTELAHGRLPELIEPPEIRHCFDQGAIAFSRPPEQLDAFRKEVEQYLHSKHSYWPIVKSVTIRGPFQALSDGVALIDLPGINDPNEAREEVTRQHLKRCRFVWIVFNIKRCLTRDTVALMQSPEFLRQLVMDGRAGSLTFVGTASEDLDPDSAREEFELRADAEIHEMVAARNVQVRTVVKEQLKEMVQSFAASANATPDDARKLVAKLMECPIFTVSAKEYLRLVGLTKSQPAGLTRVEQTELPFLSSHMKRICHSYGVAAQAHSIESQLLAIVQEIRTEIQLQQTKMQYQEELTERQWKGLRAAIEAARRFLEEQLRDAKERLLQDLQAAKQVLAERLERGVQRARCEVRKTIQRWDQIQWNTLRAVCRRGGVYKGTRVNDFPEDLASPILDGIAFAWADFFSENLNIAKTRRSS